jgi:glycosyltransferase involved in cell wall biosynthesis
MLVLQVIARVNLGGTAKYLFTLSEELPKLGIKTVIATGQVQAGEIEDPGLKKVKYIRVPNLGRKLNLLNDIKASKQLRKIIIELKPDVIHTHTFKAGLLIRLQRNKLEQLLGRKIKFVHTFHGHLLYGYFSNISIFVISLIERILARFSDRLISSGEIVRDELLVRKIGRLSKFIVIRPGIPLPVFEERDIARSRFSISHEEVVVGWLGRMEKIKRPDRLIKIAKSHPEAKFLVGGSGSEFERTKTDAPKNIIFAGWSTPEVVWGASDIALLTSDNEAQPISLIEAGLAGIPSISTSVGSVAEVIHNGETGFICSSETDLDKRLSEVIGSIELREKLGRAAKNEMLSKFGLEQFIARHNEVYEKLVI